MKNNAKQDVHNENKLLELAISNSWLKIVPFWPLKNLIAVNPLAGFEDLPFEQGLRQANAYFQQQDLPDGMQDVNRETIKWLQVFFDEGQSTIHMPGRRAGFLSSILPLLEFDSKVHKNIPQNLAFLNKLPQQPEMIITEAMLYLGISPNQMEQFLTLMLTTLAGWSSYIKYYMSDSQQYTITAAEYLAFRVILVCLLWPCAKTLLVWHNNALSKANVASTYHKIKVAEDVYQKGLLKQMQKISPATQSARPKAQLVFCIDVRSEPFRRALESQGDYETYGFAGFFGLPVAIKDGVTGDSYASCPVLLKPSKTVTFYSKCAHQLHHKRQTRLQKLKKLYQSVKYTFTTPFSMVEAMGFSNGLWMALRSISPSVATKIEAAINQDTLFKHDVTPDITSLSIDDQVAYSHSALSMMGLTENFAPLIVFCGHGSTTQNNAYATSLDCGACGGHNGSPNARILAAILNNNDVRKALTKKQINIPEDTFFVAAEHNTTTDNMELYADGASEQQAKQILSLNQALQKARDENNLWRVQEMGVTGLRNASKKAMLRSQDWAQVRPEWGLARNASFIVAPRSLTKDLNLSGRSFLHSYEWEKDKDMSSLTTILTAPMIVAQWINAQYLFSTLDNVAYGGGSKVTSNITGKFGMMQGNASDLMHGLPLQSVCKSDRDQYHSPIRLTVIVYAPRSHIEPIINKHPILKKLFGNGWVHFICYEPKTHEHFRLKRDLAWDKI